MSKLNIINGSTYIEKRYSVGTAQDMTVVMMMTGWPHALSEIQPDMIRPRLLVTPIADTRRAE